jgi:hypothetical protein
MNRRRALAVLSALIGLAVLAAPASAKPPGQTGWWFQPKDGAAADLVPAPPDAPADGLYLFEAVPFEVQGSNPFAVAAVRFTGASGAPATLTLHATSGSLFTATDVRACRATSQWRATNGPGAWADRPGYDCAIAMAFGQASSDGSSMTWPLGGAFESTPGSGVYDVVLVPWGQVPFRVGVLKPAADAVDVFEPGVDPQTVERPPVAGIEPHGGNPRPSAESGSAVAPHPPVERFDARFPRANEAAPTSSAVPEDSSRPSRVVAVVLLFGLAGTLWWFGSGTARAPRMIGSAGASARSAGPVVRGVGRFARTREHARSRRL